MSGVFERLKRPRANTRITCRNMRLLIFGNILQKRGTKQPLTPCKLFKTLLIGTVSLNNLFLLFRVCYRMSIVSESSIHLFYWKYSLQFSMCLVPLLGQSCTSVHCCSYVSFPFCLFGHHSHYHPHFKLSVRFCVFFFSGQLSDFPVFVFCSCQKLTGILFLFSYPICSLDNNGLTK